MEPLLSRSPISAWQMLSISDSNHVSDSVRPHRRQPIRLQHSWDSPGKNPGVGCHFLLQCMKVKSESEVAQSCLTLSNPMDCSLPGSSIHGIFQARVLEWGAIAFSRQVEYKPFKAKSKILLHRTWVLLSRLSPYKEHKAAPVNRKYLSFEVGWDGQKY